VDSDITVGQISISLIITAADYYRCNFDSVNIYGGHGLGVGATGLGTLTNACTRYISFEHITGVSQRWGVRVKLPPQSNYQHGWITYHDYCLVAPGQSVSIVTAEAKATVGTSYCRVILDKFVVHGMVSLIHFCQTEFLTQLGNCVYRLS
jgi:hypothetical protein